MNKIFILLMGLIISFKASASCNQVTFEAKECAGVVEVNSLSDLNQYQLNYGLKNNRYKNLKINFSLNNLPLYQISSPCKIQFSENLTHNLSVDLCVSANKGIHFQENSKVNSSSNLSLNSIDRVVLHENTDIQANQFSMVSSGSDQTDVVSIKNGTKVIASKIYLSTNSKLRFGETVQLQSDEIYLSGKDCVLKDNVDVVSNDKSGNCFLNSSKKAIFSVDKNQGYAPLSVHFSVNDQKALESSEFEWTLGNGEKVTTTAPTLDYTYQNVGIYISSLRYKINKRFINAGEITINAKVRPNLPPVASLVCQKDYMLIQCNALGSYDPESNPLTYTFSYSDGFIETNTTGLSTHATTEAGLYQISLTVSELSGLTGNAITQVQTELPPNINPIAKLNCKSLSPENLVCDAIGSSDSDGSIQIYQYTIDDQEVINFSTQESFSKNLSSGSHNIKLSVIDNRGGVATDELNILVMENHAPTFEISATPLSAVVPFEASFEVKNAIDSDPHGSISNIKWIFSDNSESTGNIVSKTITEIGSFTATAIVTDNLGLSSSKEITIEALEPLKTPPNAFFKYFYEGSSFVYLHTGEMKTQFAIKKAFYTIDEGLATQKIINLNEFYPNTIVTANLGSLGIHTIKLTVEDIRGQISSYTHNLDLKSVLSQTQPFAAFLATQSNAREVFLNFNPSFTPDRNGSITSFFIDYGDSQTKTLTTDTFDTHTYATAGTYLVKLKIQTNRGAIANFQRQVTVTDELTPALNPVASFGYRIYDYAQNVSFYNERSGSANGGIISYEWQFGDGQTGYGDQAAHFYEPGNYFVTLKVVDAMGMSSTQTQHITVVGTGDDLATNINCSTDTNLKASCRFTALDKLNQVNYINVDWGDQFEEQLDTATIPEFGMYDKTHSYALDGTYTIKLDVGTERGQVESTTRNVILISPNTVVASLQCQTNNMLVNCNALGSYDTLNLPLTYTFNYGDGFVETNNTGLSYHNYTTPGTYQVILTVTNTKNKSKTATTTVMPLFPINKLPIAKFNCDATAPHTLYCYDSGSYDPDGTIAYKEFTFDDGYKVSQANAPHVRHVLSSGGTHSVSFKVVDDSGAESVVTNTFNVLENNAPMIEVVCNTYLPQNIQCYSLVTENDPGDFISNVSWSISYNGTEEYFEEAPGIWSINKTLNHAGEITVKAVAYDQFGAQTEVTKNVILLENKAPVANINCYPTTGETYNCNANANDPDGLVSKITWNIEGKTLEGNSVLYQFTNGGTKNITVQVTDELGLSSDFNFDLNVNLPIADFSCTKDAPYVYSCNFELPTNPEDKIESVSFQINDEVFYDKESFTHEFDFYGVQKIKLSVMRFDGAIASIEKEINVEHDYMEPQANFVQFTETGYLIKFDANESYKQGRKVNKFIWNFGDGSTEESVAETTVHQFSNSGSYNVSLTVIDEKGSRNTISKTINVYYEEVPHPGSANYNTLLGVDSDNNQIRDDIQRWINSESFENSELKNLLVKIEQANYEQIMNSENESIVKQVEDKKDRMFICLKSLVPNQDDYELISETFEYVHSETEFRSKNWNKVKSQLIGRVINPQPDDPIAQAAYCEEFR